MNEYEPDHWIVVKITNPHDGTIHYRVMATWSGSYLYGESWKLNSGITHAEDKDGYIDFHGHSGSVYHCRKSRHGENYYMRSVLNSLIKESSFGIEVLSEDTNLFTINYFEHINS